MNKEPKNIVKKTAKIAGVTCIALGGAALVASGAALKALTAGAKYLKDAVQKIMGEEAEAGKPVVEVAPEDIVEAPAAEAVVEEAGVVEGEAQNIC